MSQKYRADLGPYLSRFALFQVMWVVKVSAYIILTLLYNSTNNLYNNKLLTLPLQLSFRDHAPFYWNQKSLIVKLYVIPIIVQSIDSTSDIKRSDGVSRISERWRKNIFKDVKEKSPEREFLSCECVLAFRLWDYLTVWDGNPSRVACLFEVVLLSAFYYTTSLQLVAALSNCTAQIGGSDRSVFLSAPETFGVSNACHAHSRTSDLVRLFSTNVSVWTAHFNIKALLSFSMGIFFLFISNRMYKFYESLLLCRGLHLAYGGCRVEWKGEKKKRTCRNSTLFICFFF